MIDKSPEHVREQKNCPGAAIASATSSGAYKSNHTLHAQNTPAAQEAELINVISQDRFGTYIRACQGDNKQAARLYAWNIEVASAFWGSFNVLEVTIRNVIHTALTEYAGRDDWWRAQIGLHPFEQRRVKEAIDAAKKTKGDGMRPGHVIAELTFGFWTALLANKYHQRLWVPSLHAAFPYLTGKRRDLHRKQESLRKLRNRIAHHEPIFARKLAVDHQQLLDIIGAVSPTTVEWIHQNSRVSQVLSRRTDVVLGKLTTTF